MKKLLLLFVFLFFYSSGAWAIDVQIGTGTSTSSNLPIYSCYGYNYSQQIYLASEIAAGGGSAGIINKIRFYYNSGGTNYANWQSWTIYLGNTTKASFTGTTDWIAVGSMTQVFSGNRPTPVAGTWLEITLSTPFSYSGGNLVVAVDENTAGYSCTASWRSFASGSNRGILYYSDGTNPNPASPPTANYGPNANIAQIQLNMETAACSGTPEPGNTLASPNLVLPGINIALSLQYQTLGSGVSYQWQSSPTGSDPWTNFGTSNPSQVVTQSIDTYYRCQVTCDVNTGTSNPVLVSMCPDNLSYPYFESFDAASFPPQCWDTSFTVAGTGSGSHGNWNRETAGTSPSCTPHSGAGMARFNSFSFKAGSRSILVSQSLDLPADYYLVKFWMYRDNGYPLLHDLVNVYYNTSPTTTGATLIGTVERYYMFSPVEATANAWYPYEFGLPAGSGDGGGHYVIFEGVSAWGNNIFIDDVSIGAPSSLEGYVYDYDGNPVAGALVEKVGGISTVTDADGHYQLIPLSAGSHQFKCSKPGYNEVLTTIDLPAESTVIHDFTLLQPQMAIVPGSIYAELEKDGTAAFDLDITNGGNGLLDWQASVVASGSCEYTIVLIDTYGDGWNGGKIDVLVNGSVVLNDLTILTGYGPESHTFTVSGIDEITTLYIAGSYSSENVFHIYDNAGAQVWIGQGTYASANILPGQLYGACVVPWLSLDNYTGQVDPFGGTGTVVATLNAAETPGDGETFTAEILFTHPSGIPSVSIPVALAVAPIKHPIELEILLMNEAEGKFMLKWKYFSVALLAFENFVIVKDGEIIGTTEGSFFEVILTDPGTYCFEVYAAYNDGINSAPSNEVCLTYPLAPGVPLSNWALVLGGLLIAGFAFFMIRRRA
jgi:hypothetical protein